MKKHKTNTIVKKSNALITAYSQYLDVREMRLIAQTAARITVNDQDFEIYQIPVKDISSVSNKNIYEEIKYICEKLMKRIIKIENINEYNKRQISIYNIFSRCRYVEGSGYVETRFDPDLKPFYLQLKNNFTEFNIDTLMRIPSSYSYRIYELLKQYSAGGIMYRDFEIKDLQEKLNITITHAKSYRTWGRFVEKVLKPAQKHLKKYTDIEFEFQGRAEQGRKFTHVKFKIKNKKNLKKITKQKNKLEKINFKKMSNKDLQILAETNNIFAKKELKKRRIIRP